MSDQAPLPEVPNPRLDVAHTRRGTRRIVSGPDAVSLGRLADPREIGQCVALLASPLASFVTGATLTAHGGGEVPAFLAAAKGVRHGPG